MVTSKVGMSKRMDLQYFAFTSASVKPTSRFQVRQIKTSMNSIVTLLQSKDPPTKSSKMRANSANK